MVCIDCPADTGSDRKKRCEPCRIKAEQANTDRKNARVKAERVAFRAINPYLCVNGCGTVVDAKNAKCEPCKTKKRKELKKKERAKYVSCKLAPPPKPKPRKKQLTDAEIDRRAIAITKENRRIELEMAERAARLPSHLVAARMMRGVCVSVLY